MGKKTEEIKHHCLSPCIEGISSQTRFKAVDVDLDHLAAVVLVKLLHYKVVPPPHPLPMLYSLGGSHYL